MMEYQVHITQAAERDVINASDFIHFVLKNPQAAENLEDEFEEKALELASMPEKYPLARDELLTAWGVRFVPVKNYIVFYLVDHSHQIVHIVRFLYGKNNWIELLRNGVALN